MFAHAYNIKYIWKPVWILYIPLESADYNLWRLRYISFEINLPMWYTYMFLNIIHGGFWWKKYTASSIVVGALIICSRKLCRLMFFHTSLVRRLFGMPFNDERVWWVETVVRYGKPVLCLSILLLLLYSRRDFTLFKEGQTEKNKCI